MAWCYELREGPRVWYLTEAEYKNLRVRLDRIFANVKVREVSAANHVEAQSITQFVDDWRAELRQDGAGIRGVNERKILDAVEYIGWARLLDLKEESR